jgi:tRNA pseudouridine38-40 synthase
MPRLMLTVEYDGGGFCGWQVQAEGRTVQGALEEAVRRTTGEVVRVLGAGRTDAGVHAEGQVAHFDTDSDLPPARFLRALNYWLPEDVAVLECRRAGPQFHARFSARSKLYRYRILCSPVRRPLREGFVLREWRELDAATMRQCAAALVGEHDFSSFASEHAATSTSVRRLLRSSLTRSDDELHYLVEGEGFLYNMVRIIVGTLLEVGRGKMSPEAFGDALAARDRRAAGPTAPARGLCLVRVNYPDDPRPARLAGPPRGGGPQD